MLLSELKLGDKDAAGNVVIDIYAINAPLYAVYRTNMRVMVHFADLPATAELQRQRLAALAALRGQINTLIDGWYNSNSPDIKNKAIYLDRRVADALITALENDIPNASAILTEIRDEVIADRKSRARFLYLISASVASAIMSFILLIVFLVRSSPHIEYGVAGGILGAFFSISIGIRSRTIRTDIHWRDNASDAVLRIIVGTIAGFVIVCLYRLEMMSWLKFPSGATSLWMPNFVLGFIGGFTERLIPDLLAKVSAAPLSGQDAAVAASKGPLSTAAAASAAAAATENTRLPQVGPNIEDDVDSCLCDAHPVQGEEITADSELPVATGGVTTDNVAPTPVDKGR